MSHRYIIWHVFSFPRNRKTKVKKILVSEAASVKMKPQRSCHETSCLPNDEPKRSKIQIQRTKRDALSSLRGVPVSSVLAIAPLSRARERHCDTHARAHTHIRKKKGLSIAKRKTFSRNVVSLWVLTPRCTDLESYEGVVLESVSSLFPSSLNVAFRLNMNHSDFCRSTSATIFFSSL